MFTLDLKVESGGIISPELLSFEGSWLISLNTVSHDGRILSRHLEFGGKDVRKGTRANVFIIVSPNTNAGRVKGFFILCRV